MHTASGGEFFFKAWNGWLECPYTLVTNIPMFCHRFFSDIQIPLTWWIFHCYLSLLECISGIQSYSQMMIRVSNHLSIVFRFHDHAQIKWLLNPYGYCWWFRNPANQLICKIFHYSLGFIHRRWLFGISEASITVSHPIKLFILMGSWGSLSNLFINIPL